MAADGSITDARQCVEYFQLVFLRALLARGQDKSHIALKGGCNLRFYFSSIRYSEDIDFDVTVISKETLRNKVARLLQAPSIIVPLRQKGVEISDTSMPKQTETTQRWKAGLRMLATGAVARTKIEFSRRGEVAGAEFGAVVDEVRRRHAVPPILATHYGTRAAIAQKVHALADRKQPQPRDVFDLNVLLARADSNVPLSTAERSALGAATENAVAMSFDDYASKVLAYLEPEQSEAYASREAWNAMQVEVVGRLERLGA